MFFSTPDGVTTRIAVETRCRSFVAVSRLLF